MSLRLAVATEDLNASLKKAIGLAAGTQVQGIRLNARKELSAASPGETALRQILLSVKERQMQVAGVSCPTRHALYDAEYIEPRIDVIRRSMSLVRKLETSELLIRCGRIPDPDAKLSANQESETDIHKVTNPFSFEQRSAPSRGERDLFTALCEILNDLTRYGNHVGCTLNLQLATYDFPLINRLLSEVTAGPLKICFDPATAIMTGADPMGVYRQLYRHVGYVRARDATKDVDGGGIEVATGEGNINWVELIPTLVEADYSGWVCIERTGGENRAEDVRHGVSFLKDLIPQTGD